MARTGLKALLYLLLLALVLEFVGPMLVSAGANWALGASGNAQAAIRLHSIPRAKMLLGRFDRLEVEVAGFQTDSVVVDRLVIAAESLQLELGSLFLNQELRIKHSQVMTVTAQLGETQLNEFWQSHFGQDSGSIIVQDNKLSLKLELVVLGNTLQLRIDGEPRVEIRDGRPVLEVAPVDVFVEDRKLPEPLRLATLQLLDTGYLAVPLDMGSGGTWATVDWADAWVEGGRLVLRGTLFRRAGDVVIPLLSP